jgi:hypothetical protein
MKLSATDEMYILCSLHKNAIDKHIPGENGNTAIAH